MKYLVLAGTLSASSIAFAGTTCPPGSAYFDFGVAKFKTPTETLGFAAYDLGYNSNIYCSDDGFGTFTLKSDFGIDYAMGGTDTRWAGLYSFFGGGLVGYELPTKTEVAFGLDAVVLTARYYGLNHHFRGLKESLVITQSYNDSWTYRIEGKAGNFSPTDHKDQQTLREVLVGLGYTVR